MNEFCKSFKQPSQFPRTSVSEITTVYRYAVPYVTVVTHVVVQSGDVHTIASSCSHSGNIYVICWQLLLLRQ